MADPISFFKNIIGDATGTLGIEPNNLPLVGSAFTNQNEKDLVAAMEQAAQQYRQMAPAHAQAQGQAFENQMQAYDPTNAMLGAMGGPAAQIDFDQMFQPLFDVGHPANPATPTPTPPSANNKKQSGSDIGGKLLATNPITAPFALL